MTATQLDTITVPSPREYGKATLLATVDRAEHERRQQTGGGAVTLPEHLHLLMSLPVGMGVSLDGLDAGQRQMVRRLPAGAAVIEEGQVTRLAVKPARVRIAAVAGPVTDATIEQAGGFAPFCARVIVTPARPSAGRLIEADYWGIGVILDQDGQQEILVEPRPWRPMRHTVAGWRFIEQAYKAAVDAELLGGVQ